MKIMANIAKKNQWIGKGGEEIIQISEENAEVVKNDKDFAQNFVTNFILAPFSTVSQLSPIFDFSFLMIF